MTTRIEQFYNEPHFQELKGLPEKIIQKEQEMNTTLGDNFTFSKKEYEADGEKAYLGKISDWYFIKIHARNEFQIFEDKKLITLYIQKEFQNLDKSWRGFWNREIEKM